MDRGAGWGAGYFSLVKLNHSPSVECLHLLGQPAVSDSSHCNRQIYTVSHCTTTRAYRTRTQTHIPNTTSAMNLSTDLVTYNHINQVNGIFRKTRIGFQFWGTINRTSYRHCQAWSTSIIFTNYTVNELFFRLLCMGRLTLSLCATEQLIRKSWIIN